MDIKLRYSDDETISILELEGRFDAHEVPSVKSWLERAIDKSPARVVINLDGVHFIDSLALATCVQGMKHARQRQGDIHLCSLQQPVQIIFELMRLDKAFDIFHDERSAIQAFLN
ncbi:MAG: STAS domain-containing protein [Chloroflexota bacterium]